MAILIDKLNCGTGSVGTWFDGCKTTPKDYTKAFLLAPSAVIDLATDTFDEAARAVLIKAGQLIALNDVLQVTEAGAKNNIQTLPNKKKLYISQGLLEFMMEFEASPCVVKALHKLTRKKWQLLLLDSEGKLIFDNKNGQLNGFEINLLDVDNESVNDGGSKIAMVTLTAQLTQNGTKGYNERRSFIQDDALYDINGVQDVTLSKTEGTTLDIASFKLNIVGGCDGSIPILAFNNAHIKVFDAVTGNIVSGITWGFDENGNYTPTGLTAGDRLIKLYDSINSTPVVDIESVQFYQSNILAVTLTD
jgi:hypothetical protein